MEERPIDCSGCKKQANICYRKIKNGEIETLRMCQSCPILQSNIGSVEQSDDARDSLDKYTNCPTCNSSIQDYKNGSFLGCGDCYKHFEDFLVKELTLTDSIPIISNTANLKKNSTPIHLGASPMILKKEESSKKLQSLQAALKDAVITESFEKAAILRDEIKTLMEKYHRKESKT
jgi:protein arginine kinase activator